MVSVPEHSSTEEFPDVAVFSDGELPISESARVARAVGRVLAYRGITGHARVRLTFAHHADRSMVVQVNLRVCDKPVRVQVVAAGIDELHWALMRLDRQITRVRAPWRPRPWPDRNARALTAPAEATIVRRKPYMLQQVTPPVAVAVMDAMDYDAHLFTDAEAGEDAVVYRAGPSGLRLARQRRMYPPGWWQAATVSTQRVPLIVNSQPTLTLSEPAAVHLLCAHRLRFLFFTDASTGRGHLLYPRYDGNLALIGAISAIGKDIRIHHSHTNSTK